jgi:hypothetical protein
MGEERGPAFVVWGKKDNLSNGIAEIGFAYSKAEEKMLQTNDFKVGTIYIYIYNIIYIEREKHNMHMIQAYNNTKPPHLINRPCACSADASWESEAVWARGNDCVVPRGSTRSGGAP